MRGTYMRTETSKKIMLVVNILFVTAILALNYVYQKNGFDFTLKCVCSGGFATLGVLNLIYALSSKVADPKYDVAMAAGLILACAGDVLIGYDFIVGAATFALGHVCFVIAYCFMQRMRLPDGIISGALFLGCFIFLLFCPWLTFDVPVFRVVCIVYAAIISTMLGKAVGNFLREKSGVSGIIALASGLFFFSDLMLVFDWFIGRWDWTSNACMGTYYPALCLLALSMFLYRARTSRSADRS